MIAEERVRQLVKSWDEEETAQKINNSFPPQEIAIQSTYGDIFDYIRTLVNFRFVPYLNDEIQDFFGKLWLWLNQFETVDEKKLAIKIVSKITFITEDQIRYLQEVCFQEKVRYRLLDDIIEERNLPEFSYDKANNYFYEKLDQCLIVPLTDSARYNQFVHVNDLENHSRLGLKSLEVLTHPDIRSSREAVKKLNERYEKKNILIIIEDFCGSGKTFLSDLARIASLYKGFKTIFFCPYIITERAERVIYRFARRYTPKVRLEVLYGKKLPEEMEVLSRSSTLFSFPEQQAIKAMCLKYHKKYFKDHKFIGKPRSYPFGYRDGQLLLVFQSNCPNHTLPIIWAVHENWQPLFKRIQRYS